MPRVESVPSVWMPAGNRRGSGRCSRRKPPLLARHALVLERNQGQAPVKVRYLARHGAAGVFFTADGVSFLWPKASDEPAQVEWRLVGAAAGVEPVGRNPLPSRSNYFTGSHPSQWVREVENDAEVVYPRVYPGVDLVFHDAGGDLEQWQSFGNSMRRRAP
jgi:hypothetical protein